MALTGPQQSGLVQNQMNFNTPAAGMNPNPHDSSYSMFSGGSPNMAVLFSSGHMPTTLGGGPQLFGGTNGTPGIPQTPVPQTAGAPSIHNMGVAGNPNFQIPAGGMYGVSSTPSQTTAAPGAAYNGTYGQPAPSQGGQQAMQAAQAGGYNGGGAAQVNPSNIGGLTPAQNASMQAYINSQGKVGQAPSSTSSNLFSPTTSSTGITNNGTTGVPSTSGLTGANTSTQNALGGLVNALLGPTSQFTSAYDASQNQLYNQQYYDPQGVQAQVQDSVDRQGLGESNLGANLENLASNRYWSAANAQIGNQNASTYNALLQSYPALYSAYLNNPYAQEAAYQLAQNYNMANAPGLATAEATMLSPQTQAALSQYYGLGKMSQQFNAPGVSPTSSGPGTGVGVGQLSGGGVSTGASSGTQVGSNIASMLGSGGVGPLVNGGMTQAQIDAMNAAANQTPQYTYTGGTLGPATTTVGNPYNVDLSSFTTDPTATYTNLGG